MYTDINYLPPIMQCLVSGHSSIVLTEQTVVWVRKLVYVC